MAAIMILCSFFSAAGYWIFTFLAATFSLMILMVTAGFIDQDGKGGVIFTGTIMLEDSNTTDCQNEGERGDNGCYFFNEDHFDYKYIQNL